ncbi:MAG: phosphatase PAP2 family protein [Clostridium sp.]|nr:phosphatase PAP2 family protein [Clostridium sp.]
MNTILKKILDRDRTLLKLVNTSMKCRTLDFIMPPITYLGSVGFSILFCLATLLNNNKIVHALGINTSITLIVTTLISNLIKTSVNRIRPFLKLSNLNIKKIGIDDYSFPSGHTTAAFSMAISTALLYHNIAIISIILACLVGISRMYLGVHYPTDVLAGSFLGSITSILVYNIV